MENSIFPKIPSSTRMAIIIPTFRWDSMTRSVIGSMLGVANEEVAVLIGDNSENSEKRDFLSKIQTINPNILSVSHQTNIGGKNNLLYLFDWCQDIEFIAQMADDDWMSPTYHTDSFKLLLSHPHVACAEVGTTFVGTDDGQLIKVSQPSMQGSSPLERMRYWNCNTARATMYNTSRRNALNEALQFLRDTPLPGITMAEDLWELNRLATGDYTATSGPGCLIHYPENGSTQGDPTTRFYNLLCKEAGLAYPAVYFMGLNTAIQCAVFLSGIKSPIADLTQRAVCGQFIFSHIFTNVFLPKVTPETSQSAAAELFSEHQEVLEKFIKYSNPPFSLNPYLDQELIDWFIRIIKIFETKSESNAQSISTQLADFLKSHNPEFKSL